MQPLDWICVAVLALSVLVGALRGLVQEVLSLLGWVVAFVLAQWLAADAAAALPLGGMGAAVRYAVGFVLVFVAALLATGLLAFVLSKLLSVVGMRPIDRLFGAVFGLARGLLLLLVVALVVGLTPWKTAPGWRASHGARWAEMTLSYLQPLLPQPVQKYLSYS